MSRSQADARRQALREWGAFNSSAELVVDELFHGHEFFDPHDLVQVKYEMLRRVQHDRRSVTEAAQQFGFSRTAFYQTQAMFEQQGLPGLIPKRPGPKEAHKLNPSVMEFLDQQLIRDDSLKAVDLAALVSRQFGLSVHPRSVERALARRRKKRPL